MIMENSSSQTTQNRISKCTSVCVSSFPCSKFHNSLCTYCDGEKLIFLPPLNPKHSLFHFLRFVTQTQNCSISVNRLEYACDFLFPHLHTCEKSLSGWEYFSLGGKERGRRLFAFFIVQMFALWKSEWEKEKNWAVNPFACNKNRPFHPSAWMGSFRKWVETVATCLPYQCCNIPTCESSRV